MRVCMRLPGMAVARDGRRTCFAFALLTGFLSLAKSQRPVQYPRTASRCGRMASPIAHGRRRRRPVCKVPYHISIVPLAVWGSLATTIRALHAARRHAAARRRPRRRRREPGAVRAVDERERFPADAGQGRHPIPGREAAPPREKTRSCRPHAGAPRRARVERRARP